MFFVGDTLLPPDDPIGSFQHATEIIIILNNQQNDIQGETVSHFRFEYSEYCPVQAGINIFLRLREQGCDPSTPVSDYSTPQDLCSISASSIITVVRAECKCVGAAQLGFAPEDVGTHSPPSGGAMAMHIADVPDRTLMAIGRWRLLRFMVYI